jgi:microcystin-dependent protein
MAEAFIGELRLMGFNFAPRGWARCDGQLLSIAQNTALFSLLGTTYGGNGQTTFALPDLRSRVPIHQGQGPGLSNYAMGQAAGVEQVSLTTNEMPAHVHQASVAAASAATTKNPNNALPAFTAAGTSYGTAADLTMAANMVNVGVSGGSQPHSNIQPYLTLNWCICMEGIFPSRN